MGFLKIVGKQFCQVLAVIIVVIVNIVQEENHPVPEVHLMSFAAPHHGINDGSIFGGIMIATEQPVLSSQGYASQGIFPEIIVYFEPAVQMIAGQLVVDAVGITDGLANPPFGQDLGVLIYQPFLKCDHYWVRQPGA